MRAIGIPVIVGLNQCGAAPAVAVKAVGPDVIAGAIGLPPHGQRIAAAVDGDLGLIGTPIIVGLNQRGAAPAAAVKAVGPDVNAGAIGLSPHRQRIAAAVDGDLGLIGNPCIVGLNQCGAAPGAIGSGKRPTDISRQGITAEIGNGRG